MFPLLHDLRRRRPNDSQVHQAAREDGQDGQQDVHPVVFGQHAAEPGGRRAGQGTFAGVGEGQDDG